MHTNPSTHNGHAGLSSAEPYRDVLAAIAAGQEIHADDFLIRDRRMRRVISWHPFTRSEELANFVALIVDQQRDYYGQLQFHVAGLTHDGQPLPRVTVPAKRFAAMAWVIERWGAVAVISAGKKAKLAEAILRLSGAVASGGGS